MSRPTALTDGADPSTQPPAHDAWPVTPGGSMPGASLPTGRQLAGGRFQLVRCIGRGGMGVVYEAYDRERRAPVALKTILRPDALGIYRLKNEFRALANVHHEHVVGLHELFRDGELWFFTMDMVEGVRFDDWVRPRDRLNVPRLRVALDQLVAALGAIHAAGKLHRDLKPSNVLVTRAGRVMVLDFGLVADPHAGDTGQTIAEEMVGTPEYMSPEQAAGQGATEASDYYAIGVMLFEALTGKLPFSGTLGELLVAKQHATPRLPDDGSLPQDLAELCLALLQHQPGLRPILASVPRDSGAQAWRPTTLSEPPAAREAPTLIGRQRELHALREAYRIMEADSAVVVVVDGESGIGKTTLCEAFLGEVRAAGRAVVIASRCYERESVPFKAVDPLVDELSRYLRRLPHDHAAALLPREAFALTRLFPAIARVDAVANAPAREGLGPQETQRRAFTALTELLGRIRDRQPLVVYIDDLQWMDADSADLLRHVMIDRTPLPVLFMLSHRRDDAQHPLLTRVLDAASFNPSILLQRLSLEPLSRPDAEALARRLLQPGAAAIGAAIARESSGNPFFVAELARASRQQGEHATSELSLAGLMAARATALSAGARRILEVLALAGCPLPIATALDAAAADASALDALRSAHLVRGSDGGGLITCFHDRIRESTAAALSPQRVHELYGELARSLRGGAHEADPELVCRCLQESGQRALAADYARIAADQAFGALAFDHAATFYRRALALTAPQSPQRRELMVRLGNALELAGRGAEGAAAYSDAADLMPPHEGLDLRRQAAQLLLPTGHLEAGTALMRGVCRDLGMSLPVRWAPVLGSLAYTQWRLRSITHAAPVARGPNTRDVLRLQTLRAIVTGLIGYQPVHTASAAGRYLLLALRVGDPSHRVRGLGFCAYARSMITPNARLVTEQLALMDAVATQHGDAELPGFTALMRGTVAYHRDQMTEARAELDAAQTALGGCTGADWELDAAHVYAQMAAYYCGQYAQLARTTPTLVDQALRRGRLWAAAMMSGFAGSAAWLAVDDTRGYRRQLEETRKLWKPSTPPRWPDYVLLVGEAMLIAYEGEPARAFALLEHHHPQFARSQLTFGSGTASVGYVSHRARCAAAALTLRPPGDAAGRRRMRQVIRLAITKLRRHGSTKSLGLAETFDAALHFDDDALPRTCESLAKAIHHFDGAGMAVYAAATRRRLGALLGGDHGRQLFDAGEASLCAQGIRKLEAMTELACPGVCKAS